MNKEIHFDFIWLPAYLGGYSGKPFLGMRTSIRWQKYIAEYLQKLRDIQCEEINFDPETCLGRAVARFTAPDSLPAEWLKRQ